MLNKPFPYNLPPFPYALPHFPQAFQTPRNNHIHDPLFRTRMAQKSARRKKIEMAVECKINDRLISKIILTLSSLNNDLNNMQQAAR